MNLLIFTDMEWSLGQLHSGLAWALRNLGNGVKLESWARNYTPEEWKNLSRGSDLVMTLPPLAARLRSLGEPNNRIVLVAHAEEDIQRLLKEEGDTLDSYAAYGVTSDGLASSSIAMGVKRIPTVVRCGIEYDRYFAVPSEGLRTVGYASIMRRIGFHPDHELKRGELARACALEAGLEFKIAEGLKVSEMPAFYASVDAIIMSSIQDGSARPPLEAAAAGRLVIGTPVGHWPRLAYEGLGLLAPLGAEAFQKFTVEALRNYRANPMTYRMRCALSQQAAAQRDWPCVVEDWVALLEGAR